MKNQDIEKDLNIVFFGTSDFAVHALKGLINNGYKISAVITQPEKPAGRAKVVMPSPVKKVALENNLNVYEPHNLKNDEEFFNNFIRLQPDVAVLSAYGKIIPSRYLELPKHGFINIHPSLLPKYRGPSPIQTAIMNGDEVSGVSIMKMDAMVDHGPILTQREFSILNSRFSNAKELEGELAKLGTELLVETIPEYISGTLKPKEQEHDKATFTKMLTREDGRISWNKPAEEIFNLVRALNPEPGTWTAFGGKSLNIKTAGLLKSDAKETPGTVVIVDKKIAVATSKCYLILKQIQLEGGKEMDAGAFLNGHPDFSGSKLE